MLQGNVFYIKNKSFIQHKWIISDYIINVQYHISERIEIKYFYTQSIKEHFILVNVPTFYIEWFI